MKITYKFVTGETKEIDVDEKTYNEIKELDRQLYNSDQRETRRHCSADRLRDELGFELQDDIDILAETISNAEWERLLQPLNERQKDLVHRVFFRNEKITDIAKEQGIGKSAIANRLARIYEQIKKSL